MIEKLSFTSIKMTDFNDILIASVNEGKQSQVHDFS
jgi:hypothetical protein